MLGVDPGTLSTGYGVVMQSPSGLSCVASGSIRPGGQRPLPFRLREIYRGLARIMDTYKPDECAVESAFYGRNAQSALKLGHARGVSLLAAAERSLPTFEYSPREVKKAVAGRGSASKEQVQFMVRALLGMGKEPLPHDASDALGIAICHLHRLGETGPAPRSWKSYCEAHPERVRR